jgi:hypothetical protein
MTEFSVDPTPAGVMAFAGTSDEAARKAAEAIVSPSSFIVSLLG